MGVFGKWFLSGPICFQFVQKEFTKTNSERPVDESSIKSCETKCRAVRNTGALKGCVFAVRFLGAFTKYIYIFKHSIHFVVVFCLFCLLGTKHRS